MSLADEAENVWRATHLDRWGNKLLTRGPDPDRVAMHLAAALPADKDKDKTDDR